MEPVWRLDANLSNRDQGCQGETSIVRPVRVVLFVLLVVDCVQVAVAIAALVRARRSARAGAPSHARYSLGHGLVLLAGALVLAVPVVLGLAGVISATAAVVAALVLEALALLVSRPTVKRLEAEHLARRPGAQSSG
jgi:hypothetical protein